MGLENCISNKFSNDTDAAGLGTRHWGQWGRAVRVGAQEQELVFEEAEVGRVR